MKLSTDIQVKSIDDLELRVVVPVFFNTDTLQFTATYADRRYHAASWLALREEVGEVLMSVKGIVWHPVISVDVSTGTLGINYDRVYLGTSEVTKRLRYIPWEEYDKAKGNKIKASRELFTLRPNEEFALPMRAEANGRYYLPYSEDLWNRLAELQASIRQASKDLGGILADSDRLRYFTSGPMSPLKYLG